MRNMRVLIMGILLSALFIVPAYAGQAGAPAEKLTKAKKHKASIPPQVEQVKAGGQLNERGKRSGVRNRAAAMKNQMKAGSGQQSQ